MIALLLLLGLGSAASPQPLQVSPDGRPSAVRVRLFAQQPTAAALSDLLGYLLPPHTSVNDAPNDVAAPPTDPGGAWLRSGAAVSSGSIEVVASGGSGFTVRRVSGGAALLTARVGALAAGAPGADGRAQLNTTLGVGAAAGVGAMLRFYGGGCHCGGGFNHADGHDGGDMLNPGCNTSAGLYASACVSVKQELKTGASDTIELKADDDETHVDKPVEQKNRSTLFAGCDPGKCSTDLTCVFNCDCKCCPAGSKCSGNGAFCSDKRVACPAGTHSPDCSSKCTSCKTGRYSSDSAKKCTACSAGHYACSCTKTTGRYDCNPRCKGEWGGSQCSEPPCQNHNNCKPNENCVDVGDKHRCESRAEPQGPSSDDVQFVGVAVANSEESCGCGCTNDMAQITLTLSTARRSNRSSGRLTTSAFLCSIAIVPRRLLTLFVDLITSATLVEFA